MKAALLLAQREAVAENAFAELRVWRLPRTLPGSAHDLKYRLAYVVDNICELRYDNEAEKGDHHHVGEVEMVYDFVSLDQLVKDFWNDVFEWRAE